MNTNNASGILLKSLRDIQTEDIYSIFQESMLLGNFMQHLQLHGDQPVDFIKRLKWLTKGFYAIKDKHTLKSIGYSFVYKIHQSFFYGAAILPAYYNRQVLNQAMAETATLSKYCYGIEAIQFKLTVFTAAMSKQLSEGIIQLPELHKKGNINLVA